MTTCSECPVIDLGKINIGNVDRIRITFEKDGLPWAGIDSATLWFESPDRQTQFSRTMTLENDGNGIWYYDTVVSDILTTGYWTVSPEVVDGTITKRWPGEIGFEAVDMP